MYFWYEKIKLAIKIIKFAVATLDIVTRLKLEISYFLTVVYKRDLISFMEQIVNF